jgi:hypothetical protein
MLPLTSKHAPPTMATTTATKTAPFSAAEWGGLKRLASTVHRWNEDESNGAIQWEGDNEETPRRYYLDDHGTYTKPGPVIVDRESRALESARKIASKHGLSIYHYSDPRGPVLYIYSVHDLKGRNIHECLLSVARPIV